MALQMVHYTAFNEELGTCYQRSSFNDTSSGAVSAVIIIIFNGNAKQNPQCVKKNSRDEKLSMCLIGNESTASLLISH